MYIRFVIPAWDAGCRAELGIFHAAYDARRTVSEPFEWIGEELSRELDWFSRCLAVPARFLLRSGRHGSRGGICWFQPEAREHIARARYMAWLLREAGHAVGELRIRRPGTVLWRDSHQLVAAAPRNLPRAFG